MPLYRTVAESDVTTGWQTEVPTGAHWSTHDETIALKDNSDFIAETRIGINDRFNTVDAVPANFKIATAVQVVVFVLGIAGDRDVQFVLHDDSLPGNLGFVTGDMDTNSAQEVRAFNFPTRTWTRDQIKTLELRMRTVAAGSGKPPDIPTEN